jgi:hypothetical protein
MTDDVEPAPKRGRTSSPSLESTLGNTSIQSDEKSIIQLPGALEVQQYVKAQAFLQMSDER